jgi:hypothetical protein
MIWGSIVPFDWSTLIVLWSYSYRVSFVLIWIHSWSFAKYRRKFDWSLQVRLYSLPQMIEPNIRRSRWWVCICLASWTLIRGYDRSHLNSFIIVFSMMNLYLFCKLNAHTRVWPFSSEIHSWSFSSYRRKSYKFVWIPHHGWLSRIFDDSRWWARICLQAERLYKNIITTAFLSFSSEFIHDFSLIIDENLTIPAEFSIIDDWTEYSTILDDESVFVCKLNALAKIWRRNQERHDMSIAKLKKFIIAEMLSTLEIRRLFFSETHLLVLYTWDKETFFSDRISLMTDEQNYDPNKSRRI